MKRYKIYKRLYVLILLPLSAILILCARVSIKFADCYSIKIYPILAKTIGWITGLLPFSLAEVIVVAGAVAAITSASVSIFRSVRLKKLRPVGHFAMNLAVVAAVVYFLYVLLCGVNYYRHPFTEYSGLEVRPSSAAELSELCEDLAAKANGLREMMIADSNGRVLLTDDDIYGTAERAKKAFAGVSDRFSVLAGTYPRPKPVFFSQAMSYLQISGIYFPFTAEANVNVDIPSHQIPVTMCHELTHLRGFMREDEANFIAYMACVSSDYDDFAYSGTMLALTYAMNALYSADYSEFERIYATYSDNVRSDMRYVSAYWSRFETKIGEISDKINDTYLKANNQQDGVKSYGRMVDLLLAEYRQKINS